MEKLCETCGKTFQVKPYLVDVRKHCSQECRGIANTIKKTCPTCGTDFIIWKSRAAKGQGNGTWCSKKCMVEAKKSEPKPQRVIIPPLLKVCELCGVTFRISPSRVNNARWCSKSCQSESPVWKAECSESQSGEKHWRWAGGKHTDHDGYIRLKSKKLSHESVRYEHTIIVIEWMCEVEPHHPFLIMIDGKPRLHPDVEVHHIDRVRTNNKRANLLAVIKTAHAQIHHRGKKPEPWECWPSNPPVW